MTDTVTAIVVSFSDPGASLRALRSLLAQSTAPLEVVLVDNDPRGRARQIVEQDRELRTIRIVHTGVNMGYTRAANLAAADADSEWLFFLNPDAVAEPGCVRALLGAVDGPEVAIVGAQVLLPDGRVNAGDNPINIAGVCWSGRYGEPREHGPARDVASVSGAALMARRRDFERLGGLCPHFFMYMDDADLAWRTRLSGGRVRYCPDAAVVHDYEFHKGPHKWFYLERNRLWALLANLQLRSLALLLPVLAAAEAAILRRAISEGWLGQALRAWASLAVRAPALVRWRTHVQANRSVSDYWVLTQFRGGIQTRLIDAGLPGWSGPALERYRRLVLGALLWLEGRRSR